MLGLVEGRIAYGTALGAVPPRRNRTAARRRQRRGHGTAGPDHRRAARQSPPRDGPRASPKVASPPRVATGRSPNTTRWRTSMPAPRAATRPTSPPAWTHSRKSPPACTATSTRRGCSPPPSASGHEIGTVRVPPEARHWAAIDRRLRDALPDSAYAAARAEGAQLSTHDALEWARRARGPRGRPPAGWASLTPTEARVLELATDGLSNRQIAERMFISPRDRQDPPRPHLQEDRRAQPRRTGRTIPAATPRLTDRHRGPDDDREASATAPRAMQQWRAYSSRPLHVVHSASEAGLAAAVASASTR